MVSLVDTHVHLDDPQFHDPELVVRRAVDAGVGRMVAVATDVSSSHTCIALAERFSEVFAAVGIHPCSCHQAKPQDWHVIEKLATHERVVALGETGLDGHWNPETLPQQERYFLMHWELARTLRKPVVIHTRDCEQDMLRVLQRVFQDGPLCGVMHSFTGSEHTARHCLEMGLYISFSGIVTYKNAATVREAARMVPHDRLLVETDAPYLSPEPCRKVRPNEPALLVHTATCLANIRGVPLTELAEQTTTNARRLFSLA
jgi:TatD DNase family protein